MIHMLVNLLRFSIFAEQSPEDTHSPHPEDLGWQSSLPGTLALTWIRLENENFNTTGGTMPH